MLQKYSDYIFLSVNEGYDTRPQVIYWESQLNNFLNNNWSEIKTSRHSGGLWLISFKAGDDNSDYYSVLVERKGTSDFYYMENPTRFMEKFKTEFWKSPDIYYKNLKYAPRILGDISHLKDAEKFNL